MQYAIVYNPNQLSMVALSSTDVLSDIAFEKGWRVLDQDVDYLRLQDYKSKFELEVMDNVKFYLDYLVDEELTEEDTAYIESCMQENFYEEVHPDPDEEEIDHEFHFMEAPCCDDSELNEETGRIVDFDAWMFRQTAQLRALYNQE